MGRNATFDDLARQTTPALTARRALLVEAEVVCRSFDGYRLDRLGLGVGAARGIRSCLPSGPALAKLIEAD